MVANTIRELRRSRMLSLSELARRARLSKGHLHGVEYGRYLPSLPTLEKLSIALDISVGRLLSMNTFEIVLHDLFIEQVREAGLHRLNAQQRELLLKTLRAAASAK
jgi:transcriptional regulator with XRE-family HTH domain